MDNRIRHLPVIFERIFDRALFGYICFDEVEVWVMQKWDQRLAAEEKRVNDGNTIIGTEQF